MRFFKKPENIIFSGISIIAIVLYSYHIIDARALLGAIISIVTLYYGNLKNNIENDKLFKELFETFNGRYDMEINDLLNALRIKPSRKLKQEERNMVISYFNLCAEEYLWKTKGRIPKDVWNAWKSGIKENLEISQIKIVFDEETASQRGKDSYYGLYMELNQF